MRQLDVAPFQLPHQLHIMIAGNTKCCSFIDHPHDEPQHFRNSRSAVDKITNEDGPSTIRRNCPVAFSLVLKSVAELSKQSGELFIAPVDIPDDVKRPLLMLQVVPKRLARDLDSGNFLRRGQNEHVTESFPL